MNLPLLNMPLLIMASLPTVMGWPTVRDGIVLVASRTAFWATSRSGDNICLRSQSFQRYVGFGALEPSLDPATHKVTLEFRRRNAIDQVRFQYICSDILNQGK